MSQKHMSALVVAARAQSQMVTSMPLIECDGSPPALDHLPSIQHAADRPQPA